MLLLLLGPEIGAFGASAPQVAFPAMDVTNLSPAQLRKAAEIKERIESLSSELARILGGASSGPSAASAGAGGRGGRRGGRRQMSAEGRARIAAAARARWARQRGEKGGSASASASNKSTSKSGRRTLSPAARAKIAAAARARWAKAKAANKNHL